MAIILRGKLKGQKVTPAQWCNDWVSVKNDNKLFLITALRFTDEEISELLSSKNLGYMLMKFELMSNKNRFRRKKRIIPFKV